MSIFLTPISSKNSEIWITCDPLSRLVSRLRRFPPWIRDGYALRMLVLTIDEIDRLQAITDALVEVGCGFAAVFARYDAEARRHASSGDTTWFTAPAADPIRTAFTSLSVTARHASVGVTALLPTTERRAACEHKLLESLESAALILEHAMYVEDRDRRDRERTRRRLERGG